MFDLRDLTIDDLQPERQQDRPAELLHGAEETHLPRTGIGGVHLKPRRPLRRTHPQAVAQLNRGGVLGVLVHRGQRQSGGIVFDHGGQVPIHDGDEACAVALRRGSPRGKLQEEENEGQSSRSNQVLHSGIHPWSITLAVRAEGPPTRLAREIELQWRTALWFRSGVGSASRGMHFPIRAVKPAYRTLARKARYFTVSNSWESGTPPRKEERTV